MFESDTRCWSFRMKKSWDVIKIPLMRAPGIGDAIKIGEAAVGVAEVLTSSVKNSGLNNPQPFSSQISSSTTTSQSQRKVEMKPVFLSTMYCTFLYRSNCLLQRGWPRSLET